MVLPLLAIVIAYLLGSIPFGYLLVRLFRGTDIRASGSGNIGATNVFRTTSRLIGVLTLLLDIAKAYAAVAIAGRLTGGDVLVESIAALATMVGHAFPVFLRFRGGKAVASLIGAFLYLGPLAIAGSAVVFIFAVWRTHWISLGSILGAATLPLAVWILQRAPWPVFAASVLSAVLVIWRHEANIARIRAGSESAFSLRRSRR